MRITKRQLRQIIREEVNHAARQSPYSVKQNRRINQISESMGVEKDKASALKRAARVACNVMMAGTSNSSVKSMCRNLIKAQPKSSGSTTKITGDSLHGGAIMEIMVWPDGQYGAYADLMIGHNNRVKEIYAENEQELISQIEDLANWVVLTVDY